MRAYFYLMRSLLLRFQEDKRYFRFYFQDKDIPFRNLADLALWRDDELFTDQRLAGSNPMAIQRVSWDSGNQAYNKERARKGMI